MRRDISVTIDQIQGDGGKFRSLLLVEFDVMREHPDCTVLQQLKIQVSELGLRVVEGGAQERGPWRW